MSRPLTEGEEAAGFEEFDPSTMPVSSFSSRERVYRCGRDAWSRVRCDVIEPQSVLPARTLESPAVYSVGGFEMGEIRHHALGAADLALASKILELQD